MRKVKLLFVFVLCTALIVMLTGCDILNTLIQKDGGSTPLSQILNKNTESDTVPVITTTQQGEHTVKLYFADSSGKVLVEQNRTIPKTLSLARETVSQWLMGPVASSSDSYPLVNPQTILKDIGIKNGIATVDLSKEFLEPYSNITAETALYGLVNTLTQFSTVQIVNIRVEGQDIDYFRGISLDNLRFRNDLIGYSSGSAVQDQSLVEQSSTEQSSTEQNQEVNTGQSQDVVSPSSINLFEN